MQIIEKGLKGKCEWCHNSDRTCDILIYSDKMVIIICKACLTSLRAFLEVIGQKESEV